MPCNSDHLEPSAREAELQKAAQLYIYVLEMLGKKVPTYARRAAQDTYCRDEMPYVHLCAVLRNMDDNRRE